MNPDEKTHTQILWELAEVLRNENGDPDELIDAFGNVEAKRTEIAQLLTSLLDRRSEVS